MPKLYYTVRDKNGRKITGYEDSANKDELVSRLQAKGMVVLDVTPEHKEEKGVLKAVIPTKGGRMPFKHYRITLNDLTLFCRQLATLLGAGVTILKTLDIISQQVASKRLYNVILELRKGMERGLSLHEAMAKQPDVFSELWVNLVESGEASGNLALVLERLATYMERNAAFRSKIISALIYPAILMCVSLGALLFLTLKIIPTFSGLFKGFNIELPPLTVVLIGVSDFIRSKGLVLLGAIIAGFWMLRQYIRTEGGRRQYEAIKFALPVFGDFFRALTIERFSSEMSTLVESGVPILYSLEITEHSVNNLLMADTIRKIKEDVRQGKSLSIPLEESGFFEPMVVQMVSIGEEIGELSQMFKRINTFYQQQAETFIGRFTSMFEPIMLVFMGFLIGIMVIGMFLPIFQITKIGG